MDILDHLLKSLMTEEDYLQLQENAKLYQEFHDKAVDKERKRKIEQKKHNRRRMNSR